MTRSGAIVTVLDLMARAGLTGATWAPWRAALRAVFGLPMGVEDVALFTACTGRTVAPTEPAREAWAIVGRRGGKSRISAVVAVFLALRDYSAVLAPGEVGTLVVIATDRRQARTVFRFIEHLLALPGLSRAVLKRTRDSISLRNRITIEVHTASFRSTRGYTLVGAVLDEVAFWPNDDGAADSDGEIVNALRPGMATIPGALLFGISSPYAKRGELWRVHEAHFGKDGDVLVWRAATSRMNSTVPERVIARAYAADPAAAAAEYGAEFRSDVAGYIDREIVESLVVKGRHEIPPPVSGAELVAVTDFAGGSGGDSATLCVGYKAKGGHVVLCAIRERRPPFSPTNVADEFAALLKTYGIRTVSGDRWAGEFPREAFRQRGIDYEILERTKSALYVDALAALNSGLVELLDNPRLVAQICGLERRTARGGHDSVDHAPGAHDDVANVGLGLVALLTSATAKPAAGILFSAGERTFDPYAERARAAAVPPEPRPPEGRWRVRAPRFGFFGVEDEMVFVEDLKRDVERLHEITTSGHFLADADLVATYVRHGLFTPAGEATTATPIEQGDER